MKAANEGSTFGIFIVETADGFAEAIEKAFQFDKTVVIERYIHGEEYTVSVMESFQEEGVPFALPVIQIVPLKGATYDFESKYAAGGSEHICPAPIDDEMTQLVQNYAIKAHKALGCRGVSRSDFIIDVDRKPWILETNTIPGMTATSLLPDAAKAAGISFPELCVKLIEYALE